MKTKRFYEKAKERGLLVSDEVQSAAGVTYRQLDYWCRVGLVEFSGGESSGRFRAFEPAEVDVVSLLGRLSRLGLQPSCRLAKRAVAVARSGEGGIVTEGPLSIFVA